MATIENVSSFDIVSAVVLDPRIFSWIPACADDAAAVIFAGVQFISTANQLSLIVKEVYQGILQTCIILDNCVFENFMLVDDLLAKCLQRLATCLSVKSSIRRKLVSSSPITFDDNTSVAFFVPDFNLFY